MDDAASARYIEAVGMGGETETEVEPECAFVCDRCGSAMVERNCKIICFNCGHRFDCSDLNIYFD